MSDERAGEAVATGPCPAAPKRRRVTVPLLTVIFVCGGLVGAGLTVVLRPGRSPHKRWSVDRVRDHLTEKIAERVELTDEQTQQVRGIVQARLEAFGKLRQDVILPRMKVQGRVLHDDVAALLTPAQAPKWEQFYAECSARWFRKWPSTQPATRPATAPSP